MMNNSFTNVINRQNVYETGDSNSCCENISELLTIVRKKKIPAILERKYFKITKRLTHTEYQRRSSGIVAVCQLCPQERAVRGSLRVTSNFLYHLKMHHKREYEEYTLERDVPSRRERHPTKEMDSPENDPFENIPTPMETVTDILVGCEGSDDACDNKLQTNNTSSMPSVALDLNKQDFERRVPPILNGKYFKITKYIYGTIHEKEASGLYAECQLCVAKKSIKGSLRVTSNFVNHLRLSHPRDYQTYLLEKQTKGRRSRYSESSLSSVVNQTSNFCNRRLNSDDLSEVSYQAYQEVDIEHPGIKADLSTTTSVGDTVATATPAGLNDKLMKLLVDNNLPVSIVDTQSFIDLCACCGIQSNDQHTIYHLLKARYASYMRDLRKMLVYVRYISATINFWSQKGGDIYLLYSYHWLDESYNRQSVLLVFRKLPLECCEKEVIDQVEQCNVKFNISKDKITCITLGRGSNADERVNANCNQSPMETLWQTIESSAIGQDGRRYGYGIQIIHKLIDEDFYAPLRANDNLYGIHKNLLKIVTSEGYDTDGSPSADHWRWLYDAVQKFFDNFENALLKLTLAERGYLQEYCDLIRPLVEAYELILRSENMLYGYLLPILVTLYTDINNLYTSGRLKLLHGIAKGIVDNLRDRLQTFVNMPREFNAALIAALTCPIIKLRFLPQLRKIINGNMVEDVFEFFSAYAKEFIEIDVTEPPIKKSRALTAEDFFNFNDVVPNPGDEVEIDSCPTLTSLRREWQQYLDDNNRSLNCLEHYSTVEKVFVKYNTPLPMNEVHSQLIDRSGNKISMGKHSDLSVDDFEQYFVMKANNIV